MSSYKVLFWPVEFDLCPWLLRRLHGSRQRNNFDLSNMCSRL